MITLEESKTHAKRKNRISIPGAYNQGLQDAQDILIEVYELLGPKKLNETHYLLDLDIEYEY